HPYVEYAEDFVDRFGALTLFSFVLASLPAALFLGVLRELPRVLLGVLPPLAIHFLEIARRYGPPVFGDQPPPPSLARQSRVALEDLQQLAGRPSGAVEFLLTTLLDVHVT